MKQELKEKKRNSIPVDADREMILTNMVITFAKMFHVDSRECCRIALQSKTPFNLRGNDRDRLLSLPDGDLAAVADLCSFYEEDQEGDQGIREMSWEDRVVWVKARLRGKTQGKTQED